MSRAGWRTLAIILALFAAGHTLGTAAPHVTRGAAEASVFQAMQGFRFPVMGFERSYAEFYRGFGLFVSMTFAILAVIAYQLSVVSKRDPRPAMPMAITLQAACVTSAILSWQFFFAAPIVMSLVAVACSTMATANLVRDSRVENLKS